MIEKNQKQIHYLCIHGHFYQPPRENAWIDEIEEQMSAAPFHDWNERIYQECYLPNSLARVLDGHWKIADIVNNYEWISFNFGPTLLAWIEKKHPEAYTHILEADQKSQQHFSGHGNAIAQAYNHMILPLANERDKITQVRWGLKDFSHRFGRPAESIWLPETACNDETMEVLIQEGLRFLILEPHQAKAVRLLESKEWHDVSSGQIDPKQAYRCFSKKNPEKFVDIFFYDGPISKAVGFEDILFDAKKFADRIDLAKIETEKAQLIHIATDGETYGHHKAFGERALAYLLNVEAPKRGYQITNYGEFLDHFSPAHEVKLKQGDSGEGTSWSCPHGVKRWKDHCGCRGDGPGEWTQHWRKPLRESLDWLRDEGIKLFETQGTLFLKDVWEARNDYIHVVLNRSEKQMDAYFSKHASKSLSPAERVHVIKLLEMQRYAMLMYTSCGWFFTELSGIETLQILQYAARVIELVREVSQIDLENAFMEHLEQAKSNVSALRNGKKIYEQLILPYAQSMEGIASVYAIASTVDRFYHDKKNVSIYHFSVKVLHERKEILGGMSVHFGRLKILSKIFCEEKDLIFVVVKFGRYDFRCSIKPYLDEAEFLRYEKAFFYELHDLNVVDFLRKVDELFGKKYYDLKHLPLYERKQIISVLAKETLSQIAVTHEKLFDEHRKVSEIYRSINLPIPADIRYAAEFTLNKRLRESVRQLASDHFDLRKAWNIFRIIRTAKSFDVSIKNQDVIDYLSDELLERCKGFLQELDEMRIVSCLSIIRLARRMEITLDIRQSQEVLFLLLKNWEKYYSNETFASPLAVRRLLELAQVLEIQVHKYRKFFGEKATS